MQKIYIKDNLQAHKIATQEDCGASLVAQGVKNPPAKPETWALSLGQEDPLEKEMATNSSILAWEIPWGRKESDMTERISLTLKLVLGNRIQAGMSHLLTASWLESFC